MKVFRKIAAAFALYSRIPVVLKIQEEDTEHAIMFLPRVGALIAGLEWCLLFLFSRIDIPDFVRPMLLLLVPIVLTGGFHIDGFLDTVDALRSYKSKEEKLSILKDPHVGAFAIIGFVSVLLIMLSAEGLILSDEKALLVFCVIFPAARALTGLTSVGMKKARSDGMLVKETAGGKRMIISSLLIELLLSFGLMGWISLIYTGAVLLGFGVFTLFYYRIVTKNFGGVTGDTAGYYVVGSETAATVFLAVCALLLQALG